MVRSLAAAILVCSAHGADYKLGHSHVNNAFNEGPRQKPVILVGIGEAHLPITTKNPEVQLWFDRGVTLLHSFWYYEAERAFRWCNKLEPENAMVYWGLARAAMSSERGHEFLREAVRRKGSVSERERLYIEALETGLPDPYQDRPGDGEGRNRESKAILEKLVVRYPEDMEARAFLALDTMGGDRYGAELIIREVLAKLPDHPGAHHYRIHNWDYNEPEQALVSARRYGELVPGIGHALHMPGHIYSIVGMWNEAAISMDAATRAEKQYMKDSLTFSFNNWNYGHNRYYLSYIQEQLGLVSAAIFGSKQLIDAPKDPKDNNDEGRSPHSYGIAGLARALTRFERWDALLDGKTIPWREGLFQDKMNRAYFETRAGLAKGDLGKAEKSLATHAALKSDLVDKNKQYERLYSIQALELKGRLAIAREDSIRGLGWLAEAAAKEFELQREYADPPVYPESLYCGLGEAYLATRSPLLAAQAFEKAAELTKMDFFALSGLVRAYAALGEKAKAEDAMARLLYVTADAEPGIRLIEAAKATGVVAVAHDGSPGAQRNYVRTSLEKYGPEKWEPYAAPSLDVRDAMGKRVTLAEYRGKNVMLVYYLGRECAHCVEQLHKIGKMKDEWARLDTVLLAVSSQGPEANAKAVKDMGELPWRLLSDSGFENARRWRSYDDFEEMELHSTILVDKKGRVYWGRFGGDPFGDTEFLVKQIERMNSLGL